MAQTGIFCSGLHVERKAGINANPSGLTEDFVNDFIQQAESTINVLTQTNWSDSFSGLNTDTKMILRETASNMAAMYAINYDMSGFTSRAEAQTMLNVLRDAALRGVSILRDINKRKFINGS